MPSTVLFRLLETSSSEVSKKDWFNSRYTTYIPDFFFVFLYISVFLLSALLDRLFILNILADNNNNILGSFFLLSSLGPLIYTLLYDKDDCFPEIGLTQVCRFFVKAFFLLLGMESILIGGQALTNAFEVEENVLRSNSLCFFHIPNRSLSLVKIYCCIVSAIKSIPQLFIASAFLLVTNNEGPIALIALATIFFNMIIFSLTMAVTFPVRKSPRIFKSCCCVVLNALVKFMATMCACGLNLTIFALLYPQVGYIAFLPSFVRMIWSVWPSWRTLSSQSLSCSYQYFFGFFLSLFFSFIYIHPFEGKGKMFYYYFYLLTFFTEIAFIYTLTDADYDYVIIYYTMRILIIGFISCFGLVNILQNVKGESQRGKKTPSERSELKEPSERSVLKEPSERSVLKEPSEVSSFNEMPSKST